MVISINLCFGKLLVFLHKYPLKWGSWGDWVVVLVLSLDKDQSYGERSRTC